MHRTRFLFTVTALILLISAPLVRAQARTVNVSGKWAITLTGDHDPVKLTLQIEQKGQKLSGSVNETIPFTGEVKGNGVTIRFTRSTEDGPIDVVFEATVAAGTMKGTSKRAKRGTSRSMTSTLEGTRTK
jgi:hypothetical protein